MVSPAPISGSMPVRIDVTQEHSVLDALAEAERNFGKLHIACNNAGVPMHGTRLIDALPEDWEFVIGVNVWGVIQGIRHFLPAILRHGEEGHVVNTASVAGFQNRRGTNQGPYSMSKYAVLSLSEALEHELEGTNVGVSVLCPGPIATNIARGARNRPDHMGGPQIRANEEAVLAERLASTGLDPKRVGERVVDAIRNQDVLCLCQRRSRRNHQGPPPPHRGRPEQPMGHPLLTIAGPAKRRVWLFLLSLRRFTSQRHLVLRANPRRSMARRFENSGRTSCSSLFEAQNNHSKIS